MPLYNRNESEKGIALLTVMVIMTVLVITGSLLLKMSSSESRIIDNYGDNSRAYYVAEAGADLVIKQWKSYVGSLALVDGNDQPTDVKADVGHFLSNYLNPSAILLLEEKIRAGYSLASGSSKVSIIYSSNPSNGYLDKIILPSTPDPKPMLTITLTGNYDGSEFEQKVQLWYYWNGTTGSYKGYGTATVNSAPAIPGDGESAPPYEPPISQSAWNHSGGPGQWDFDTTNGIISRTPESPHNTVYTDDTLRVPFSLNMYVSFELQNPGNQWQWPGSEVAVGLGYIPVEKKSSYSVALKIVGSTPQVEVTIKDQNNNGITVPATFTRLLDSSSRYKIQVNAITNSLSINIIDDITGQKFKFTSATTLRDGRLILADKTNQHVDPKFTFPP